MKRLPLIFIFLLSSCTLNLPNAPISRPPLSDFFEVSDTCPHTCFMGINPGVTTKDEVVPLITASDQFSYPQFDNDDYEFYGHWFTTGSWINVIINPQDNLVKSIKIPHVSPYTTEELIELLGEPDEISISLEHPADASYIKYAIYYTELIVMFYSRPIGFTGPQPDDRVQDLYINTPIDDEHVPFWIIDDFSNRQPWMGYGNLEEYLPDVEIP